MKKIAVSIQKGGVGKTTVSGNVAYGLAAKGAKVLAVDCDPQGNLTNWFLDSAPAHELADVLEKRVSLADAITPVADGLFMKSLFVLPTFGVGGGLRDFADTKLMTQPYVFRKLCQQIEAENFDYAIFDLSPGSSMLEKSILAAVDEVITPLTPEYFSVDGLQIFAETMQKVRDNLDGTLKHDKIILNLFNRSFSQHIKFAEAVSKLHYKIYTIGQDRKMADGQSGNLTAWNTDSKNIPELQRLAADLAGA
jgi:cellulose biosynthesis protein BcsQ